MILRRLAGLLASLTMLHLSVAAGVASCLPHATGAHHAPRSTAAAASDHGMGMAGHAMPAAEARVMGAAHVGEAGVPPCEVPTPQHCCDADVGCGITGAIAGERPVLAALVAPAPRIRETVGDAPASFAPAPEPPPPKA